MAVDKEMKDVRDRRLKQKQQHREKKSLGDAAYDGSSSNESRYRDKDSSSSDSDMPGMADQPSEDAEPALTEDNGDSHREHEEAP